MINIQEKGIKFNDLERSCWEKYMFLGREEIKSTMIAIDNQLLKEKNNKELIVKDFQPTTIKTKFGDIEFSRRRYKLLKNNEVKFVYLLDIYLEFGYEGQYSQSIVEMVLKLATEQSYRKTAEVIVDTTNANITYTAARKILINFSKKKIEKIEQEKLKLYEKGYIEGEKEVSIIYEEADGIYISKQDRKKNKVRRKGKKLKQEIKIGIVHEGFEHRYNNDFKIKNKQIVATTKNAQEFKRLVDMTIGTTYKEDTLEKIIINADGADWTSTIANSPKEKYQLDMLHIQKHIREAVSDEEYINLMSKIVKTSTPNDIFNIIFNYKVELDHDNKVTELEKVIELEKYLRNNEKGLLRYQYELNLSKEEKEKLKDTDYRNLGTEESQMYCVCRKRMKRNRTSWRNSWSRSNDKSNKLFKK